jgi:hypothetical protein
MVFTTCSSHPTLYLITNSVQPSSNNTRLNIQSASAALCTAQETENDVTLVMPRHSGMVTSSSVCIFQYVCIIIIISDVWYL